MLKSAVIKCDLCSVKIECSRLNKQASYKYIDDQSQTIHMKFYRIVYMQSLLQVDVVVNGLQLAINNN